MFFYKILIAFSKNIQWLDDVEDSINKNTQSSEINFIIITIKLRSYTRLCTQDEGPLDTKIHVVLR